jgi:hypothetical protein
MQDHNKFVRDTYTQSFPLSCICFIIVLNVLPGICSLQSPFIMQCHRLNFALFPTTDQSEARIFAVSATVHHWYNNINSQLDATITNLIDNYNQLNMFRTIISPILRRIRLCLQLVVPCTDEADCWEHRWCVIPQAVNTV